jgi:hypothetical protein
MEIEPPLKIDFVEAVGNNSQLYKYIPEAARFKGYCKDSCPASKKKFSWLKINFIVALVMKTRRSQYDIKYSERGQISILLYDLKW